MTQRASGSVRDPIFIKGSMGRWREQGGIDVIRTCINVQNFQRIKQKYVKKVNHNPEQSLCSTVSQPWV